MNTTERELDLQLGDLHDENAILKRQLAEVTRERDELRQACLEQMDMTIQMRDRKPESIYTTRFRNLMRAISSINPRRKP